MDICYDSFVFIGKKILKRRKELGLTQVKLAEKIGVGYTSISAWENGRNKPSVDLYPKLADALGVDLDFFDIAPDPAPQSEVLKEIAGLKVMMEQVLSSFEMRPSELEGKDEE